MNLDKIKNQILPILKDAGVTKSAIFGSYARGEENKDSDLDILVDLPDGKTLLDLAGLQLSLEEKLGIKVDVLTYGGINPLLRDYIFKDQIPVL